MEANIPSDDERHPNPVIPEECSWPCGIDGIMKRKSGSGVLRGVFSCVTYGVGTDDRVLRVIHRVDS